MMPSADPPRLCVDGRLSWQVTLAVIIAVEEFPFLVTVHRTVRGIEVKNDLLRRLGVSIQKQVNQPCFDS